MKNPEIDNISNFKTLSKEEVQLIMEEVKDNWKDHIKTRTADILEHEMFTLIVSKKNVDAFALCNRNANNSLNFNKIKKILNMKTFW